MRWISCAALGVVCATAIALAADQPEAATKHGVFAKLKVGQSVGLKEVDNCFVVSVLGDFPQSHVITEVGSDYLALRDVAGVMETRIPVFAIKAVQHVRTRPE